MSQYLYANPDGIRKVAMPYNEAAARFTELSGQLEELRSRYRDCWGNDDGGKQMRPQIEKALISMQTQVDQLGKALGMYSDGLIGTAKSYDDANNAATDASKVWSNAMEPSESASQPAQTTEGRKYALRSEQAPLARTRATRMEGELPLDENGQPVHARKALRALAYDSEGHPLDQNGQPVLGADGQPLRRAMVSMRREQAPYAPGVALDENGQPILDENGKPMMRAMRSQMRLADVQPGLEPLEPAHITPALSARFDALPAQPAYAAEQPLQPAHITPALSARFEAPLAQQALPGIPAEPGIPVQPLLPAQPGIPAQTNYALADAPVPTEPAHILPAQVNYGQPLEPLQPTISTRLPGVEPEPAIAPTES